MALQTQIVPKEFGQFVAQRQVKNKIKSLQMRTDPI